MVQAMADIKITLETLYDILRNEKKREDLQQLEGTFFLDVVSYLREKKALLDQPSEDDLFSAGEKEKLEYELRSIKRILKEIYERREKKIIDIALNKSRTGSDIIDTTAMLREEKKFYEEILASLDLYRRGVLFNLFLAKIPHIGERVEISSKEAKLDTFKKSENAVPTSKPVASEASETKAKPETKKVAETAEPPAVATMTKVKFIRPMPSFVWKDMKVYGPYEEGDEIEIFPEVANLLVRKKRAEKV